MTREEIIGLAQEAGFLFHDAGYAPEIMHTEPHQYSQKCFERFAALVAATEREACAVAAWSVGMDLYLKQHDAREIGAACARAIRTRGI